MCIRDRRYADSSQYPCLMVYLGKSETGGRRNAPANESTNSPAHRLLRCGGLGDKYESVEEMRSVAIELSGLKQDAINDLFRIRNLRDFDPDKLLFYSSARKQPLGSRSEELWVVSFECVTEEGESRSGEVIIPSHYAEKLMANPAGLIIYRGMKSSVSTGREHYDLEIVFQAEAENWVKRLCDGERAVSSANESG